jgi:NADPH-dependent F420 reductase
LDSPVTPGKYRGNRPLFLLLRLHSTGNSLMEIAILGTGNVGATLGRKLAKKGHRIVFGSRKPASERALALVAENSAAHQADSISGAVAKAAVVVLAVPFDGVAETLREAGNLQGKTVIDCSNPLNPTFDGLLIGFDDSAAEQIQRQIPLAKVVKAFNTASVATMQDPDYNGITATMFYCGDDQVAKQQTAEIIGDLGMEPVDCGPLKSARHLEPMAMLYIHLAVQQGWGGQCALKMLTRETQ